MRRQHLVIGLGLVAALIAPLYALAAGVAWLVVRILSYARAPVVEAGVVGWQPQADLTRANTRTFAPDLRFIDRAGRERIFRSSLTHALDPELVDPSLLPSGPFKVRYREAPFFAEVEDPKLWFTPPCLLIAVAGLAGMLRYLVYAPLLRLFG
jgi:hypothetical protein